MESRRIGGASNPPQFSAERISASIVKEFLARKKLANTAATMDRELPWTKELVTSSSALAQALHLDKVVKKYKGHSLSLLEIILSEQFSLPLTADSSSKLAKKSTKNKERTVTDSTDVVPIDRSDEASPDLNADPSVSTCRTVSATSPRKMVPERYHLFPQASKVADMDRGAFVMSWKNLESTQKNLYPSSEEESSSCMFPDKSKESLRVGHRRSSSGEIVRGFDDLAVTRFPPHVSLTRRHRDPEDVKVDDISDSDLENDDVVNVRGMLRPSLVGRYINLNEAVALKKLLFGSTLQFFSPEWCAQNFEFCDNPSMPYGLVQHKGGPCGVLAAVQGHVFIELLFNSPRRHENIMEGRLRPSEIACQEALAKALATILWRAGGGKQAIVAVPTGCCEIDTTLKYRPDGFTEKLFLASFASLDSLVSHFWQRCDELQSTNGRSCISLVYSAILSRGIDRVMSDMDDPQTTLIGRHSYCTQELVNLLLIGHAVSNVFDNEVQLESDLVLRGIPGQCEIGLLSLFEHYNSCEVGSYYKCPLHPVWVVLSESHFSILFGVDASVLNDGDLGRPFDLFYYDGLGRHSEEIRLTIEPNAGVEYSLDENDLIPPLEHCIRTRWKGARVKWQGVEPLL